jgi:hypothetical protein
LEKIINLTMRTSVIVLTLAILFLCGCSSRVFYISLKPEGSLLRHQEYYGYSNIAEAWTDEIPYKVLFAGKNRKTSFSAMKRGYYEDTIWVTRESAPKISFNLRKLSETDSFSDYLSQLPEANLFILPPKVDVILHKGAGNLSRYEKSDLQSYRAGRNILAFLSQESEHNKRNFQLQITDKSGLNDTFNIPDHIMKYLFSIKPDLLRYYSIPPSIKRSIRPDFRLQDEFTTNIPSESNTFWAVVYLKTIKPTSG